MPDQTKEFKYHGHPECPKEYCFLGDLSNQDFDRVGWVSKIKGIQTYEKSGKPIHNTTARPVFASKEELVKAGYTLIRSIDLQGPEGNVFVLMQIAAEFAEASGKDMALIHQRMMSSDYQNAVDVLKEEFSEQIEVLNE